MQATEVSLLHWKSGLGLVDHFKILVPGLHASSSVPVWKGMPKVKEDQRSTVSLVSLSGVLQVTSYGTLAGIFFGACAAQVLDGETPAHHQLQRRQGCRRC